ncbi:RNA polymerase sigma-28 factor precursor [Sporotomaculum syntrophicum]|uniref:RNA polymerase sigma factor n=1 Tax=Sporotomaculum syntrophicum TaxID=182264 RepID=A0A9D3AZC5_9FIRM|nr:RNA polymerase sporulation sigma factor SigK [Sporotomaculum syntrophicum]KAF1086396.1 RNA polymerase sigma-28 factor precursor [Sporotomaculum syntrophicum]
MPGFWTLAVASIVQGIILLISYVAQNSFPKPLTEEEEKLYLEKLAQGDEKAKEVLIERNLRLVAHIIKKFENSGDDFDDLISIGTIGLIKAVNTFNADKSSRLATYASRCIENEILMYMRSKKKKRSEMSLYEPIGTDKEGNEIHFMDVLSTDAEAVSEMVSRILDKEQLWKKLKNLPPQEMNVLVLRFGLRGRGRKTQREIAKKLGISRSYVSRIEKRAIDRLSEQFSAEA